MAGKKKETAVTVKTKVRTGSNKQLTPSEQALADFQMRKCNPPRKIDNSSLPAGSSMYFYCRYCDALSDVFPELYRLPPARICEPCQTMKDNGWLD